MDKDDSLDPALEHLARTLRRPVPVSPDFTPRLMARLQQGHPRRWPWAVGLASAAVLLLLALARPWASLDRPPREVDFGLLAPEARTVALAGDFNDWDPVPLERTAGGRWHLTVPLPPGRYHFTFVVDGSRWVADPRQPRAPDDFGEPTSVITVLGHSRS